MNAGEPYDDEQFLLDQLRGGNERAFNYFYKRYSLIIYRKIKKMVKVDVLADELMQDVFVRLWDKRHLIDPEKSLRSYLFLIAQNIVYDFYRKLGREERLQSEVRATFSEVYQYTEEEVILKETTAILNEAIEHLPTQQRTVFRMCKMEGKSYQQVSDELGISTSTINQHIVRATKSIKDFMFNYNHVAVHILVASVIADLAKKL